MKKFNISDVLLALLKPFLVWLMSLRFGDGYEYNVEKIAKGQS